MRKRKLALAKGNSGNGSGRAFDWGEARQRLSLARTRMGGEAESLDLEALQRIWTERALRFAEAPAPEDEGEHVQLVIVRLGCEYYGLDANYIFRIRPAAQITRVPRTPAWVKGVANERGRILSVFDVQCFLGLSQPDHKAPVDAPPSLIIVETPEMELALLVDEVLNVVSLPVDDVQEAVDAVRGIPPAYVAGVVSRNAQIGALAGSEDGALIMLNLRALLADERLRVHEEIV
ncbi:MAG: purine-binding chemotaxis protein CheW [Anaerolineae bacterium]|nr:purine-binding chemotaxis protein CheW [Anaerolineae bacterium]